MTDINLTVNKENVEEVFNTQLRNILMTELEKEFRSEDLNKLIRECFTSSRAVGGDGWIAEDIKRSFQCAISACIGQVLRDEGIVEEMRTEASRIINSDEFRDGLKKQLWEALNNTKMFMPQES